MQNSNRQFILALLSSGGLLACGGAALPQAQLTDAKVSASAAEAVGAREEPAAALHLKMAENAIAQAEKDIASGNNAQALLLLERARSDAELAKTMTEAAESKTSADAAISQLNVLKLELQSAGGQS